MSKQQHSSQVAGKQHAQAQEGPPSPHHREPSMQEVAERIAARLGVSEETSSSSRIMQVVWELGRTQAQALCEETLQPTTAENRDGQTPANIFFHLVDTKGQKKKRPWLARPGQQPADHLQQSQVKGVAELIADQLGEQEAGPRQTIYRSVRTLGVELALALLNRTHETEQAGGMMLPDQSRRRTAGGVYFWLVRQEASQEQRRRIFPIVGAKRPPVQSTPRSRPHPERERQAPAAFLWAERQSALNETGQKKGEVRTVKITLIGRPGKIADLGQCIVTNMQQGPKIPALPAGLPLPTPGQSEETTYTVYIAAKQWKKVAEAIADPEDILIVEGWPMLDKQQGTIAVFGSNVTTKNLQMAQKQARS